MLETVTYLRLADSIQYGVLLDAVHVDLVSLRKREA